ncbi:MAG: nuclease-related domain-containing protein [Bacilli bacterium]|jgi:PHD/YefM family antitoxin component YafN of YafNO toxin-antitoxin module
MIFLTLTATQIVLIIVLTCVVIGLICLGFYLLHLKIMLKRNIVRVYFKTVNKVALYNDYYLINDFRLEYEKDRELIYDHLLFGDKYIYVIKDRYYKGLLRGERSDATLRLVNKKTEKETLIENPILENDFLRKKLALRTQIEEGVFISIVLVNDECDILSLDNNVSNSYIINRKDFASLIEAIESRDINPFNKEQLATIVSDIDKLNRRKKAKKQKKNDKRRKV